MMERVGNEGADLVCERTETEVRCPLRPGDLVTVEAEPNLGSTFVSWSGACSGTERITKVTVGATNARCTARFDSLGESRLRLGLNAPADSGAQLSFVDGAGEAQSCRSSLCHFQRNLPPGQQVLIRASFADDPTGRGWRVADWHGDCSGDGNQAGIVLGEFTSSPDDRSTLTSRIITAQLRVSVRRRPRQARGEALGLFRLPPAKVRQPVDTEVFQDG